MPLLTRKKQLAAVAQTGSAVAADVDLDLPAASAIITEELSSNLDVERIERLLVRDSLTSVKDLPGQIAVDLTFNVELKGTRGGTFADGAPLSWLYLGACGFRVVPFQTIPIGAITATGDGGSTTFRHGETVTQTGSGATAKIVSDWHNGSPRIAIDKDTITGAPAGAGAWVGGDSGASADPSAAPSDAGYAASPITDPTKSILFDNTGTTSALAVGDVLIGEDSGAVGTVEVAVGAVADAVVVFRSQRGLFQDGEVVNRVEGEVLNPIGTTAADVDEQFVDWAPLSMRYRLDGKSQTVAGARGNVVFSLEVNRQAKMQFTFRGVLVDLTDRPSIPGVPYDASSPPLWESSLIGFAANDSADSADLVDEIVPCLSTVSFDLGVQLADRKCAGATNGLLEVRGNDRQGSGSMDPEDSLEADTGWLTAITESGVFRLGLTVGQNDGNRFEMKAPGIQFTDASEGDRDGFATQDLNFRLTGGDLYDLDSGATEVSSIGGDNEFVLLYYTA